MAILNAELPLASQSQKLSAGTFRPVVAIDASRNRSGGAKTHLLGILTAGDPRDHGIYEVHVWSYDTLLSTIPDAPWLSKHAPLELRKSLWRQLWWQYWKFPLELRRVGCDILLSTDAGSVCRYTPAIVMSRDMLSFEYGEMQRFPLLSFARLRLFLLRHVQIASLRRSDGAIFLTHYAAKVIQNYSGQLPTIRVIPHGISDLFRGHARNGIWPNNSVRIRCVYVSNADLYKHQWHVVRAIALLRKSGHPITIRLVGGGSGPAAGLLESAIEDVDPDRSFVEVLDAVPHSGIPAQLAEADLFVFASSCENMPNTLVEAMAAGLPIACSNRGPMPEILQDAGTYFDPEDAASIAAALEELITNRSRREYAASRAMELAAQYSWARCARETWDFVQTVSTKIRSAPALTTSEHDSQPV